MNTTSYADWSQFSGPFVELHRINQETAEKITREVISFATDNAATVAKSTQILQRVTSPEDFFSTQVKLVSQQCDKNLEFCQNLLKIYQDALKEQTKWTDEKGTSAIKSATKAVKKTAEDSRD